MPGADDDITMIGLKITDESRAAAAGEIGH